MWKVGLNKSQVNYSREASEDDGNKSHKGFHRVVTNSESRIKPQMLKRSQSKSSFKNTSRIINKQSEDKSRSIEYSRKDSQFNPFDSLIKTETKISNNQNETIDKHEDQVESQIFDSINRHPLKKAESIFVIGKVSIGVQTGVTSSTIKSKLQNQNQTKIYQISELQKTIVRQRNLIEVLTKKIQTLQKSNSIYQLKIVDLQINFGNLRSQISKQLSAQKTWIVSNIVSISKALKQLKIGETEDVEKKQLVFAHKRSSSQTNKRVCKLSPQKYINNILSKIHMLKQRSEVRSSRFQHVEEPKMIPTKHKSSKLPFHYIDQKSQFQDLGKNKQQTPNKLFRQKYNL